MVLVYFIKEDIHLFKEIREHDFGWVFEEYKRS
jgi:hypothetical protein